MVRPMMNLTTLPKSIWGYTLESAARILNMVPIKKAERTPYDIWHGKAPKLSYLRVQGCYPKETMGYYFYYPPENKIFVALNAEFFKNSLMIQEASGSHGLLKISGNDKGLELIQEEDTQPSKNTSKEYNEVMPIEVQPKNVKVPIRRSARIPQAQDIYGFYVDVDEYELVDLNEPSNYKAVLSDPEYDKWLEAINTEMQSIKDNQVWILVELPPNGQTVESKWLFKNKTDMDGNVHTFKARLVAKGYTQTYDVDYRETFSLVADIRAIRILLAITVFYDYEIWQMDVKTTFLNGHLGKDVYMVQPEGFVDPKHPNKVYKRQCSIYGLKQASRSWDKRIENSKKGYTPMMEKPDYKKSQGAKKPSEVQRMQRVPYASAIGSIMNTKDLVLVCEAKLEVELKVSCYADATEYIAAAAEASMKAVRMRKFIDGLGDVVPSNKRPMEMLRDNEPAIAITVDPGILKGARHFQRKYHYIREVIQEREIILKKVHTDDNVADPFTKPMSFNKHYEHVMAIGIVPASSLM
ncbi:retrotransposon protein, putative, ty1-copia subclass [Tanacetum coccineum]